MTHDGKPMIENSDRGITLAKPLAWTMLVSVIGAVWYGGGVVASLNQSTQNVLGSLAAIQAASVQVEGRVRALENNASRQDARFEALKQSLDEVKEQGRETNTLLRQLMQGKSR
jgi:chromosome segregation ATPase